MPTRNDNTPDDTSDREIVITRVFDAPRQLAFDAFTDPKHISLWWGPRGFRTTTHEYTLKPGGLWRFVMHGPDGRDYDNRVVFTEVSPPQRLAYEHGSDQHKDENRFRVTASFADEGGKTKLTFRMVMRSKEQRDELVKFGATEGGNQTLERFSEYLATKVVRNPSAAALAAKQPPAM